MRPKMSAERAGDDEEKTKVFAALSYILIIAVIGVPLWWKTTEVYRVSLPYEAIRSLREQQIVIPVQVTVVLLRESLTRLELENLKNRLNDNLGRTEVQVSDTEPAVVDKVRVDVSFDVRRSYEEERTAVDSAKDLAGADLNLKRSALLDDVGSIKIVLLPPDTQLISDSSVHVGIFRFIFARLGPDVRATCERVARIVRDVVINPQDLQRISERMSASSDKRSGQKPDKASMRSLPSSPEVDVTFTLILPDPSLLHVVWDIVGSTRAHLEPFAAKLGKVVSLNVNSQVLHLLKLDIHGHYNTQRKHYALSVDQLPHVINPIEGKLGSHVSTNPSLNFVVYVPPANQSPLQIYDERGDPSPLNAFLVPRWGGFLLHNVEWVAGKDGGGGTVVAPNATSVDMLRVMGVFLEQLRALLGVRNPAPHPDVVYVRMDSSSIRDWEYDALLRMKMVENLLKSSSTLQSLAQLLEEISNMVIDDVVGQQVVNSVEKLKASHEALSVYKTMEAFALSKESFVSSEAAFFDPSMLALLYFPDDQKYAIYVPLMLPVSLPLLLSLFPVVKWFRSRRLTKKATNVRVKTE